MILSDLHVHSCFSDGDDTPEDIVLAAIEKNMDTIGFSDHSYTFFDESYCMKKENIAAYKSEISRLKVKYKGKIKILCGIEQDFYSNEPTDGYDYVIGSVHYLKAGDDYFPVDEGSDYLINAANTYYGGDIYKLCEVYFDTVSKIKNADIIGHFDLITKFNESAPIFDEKNERFVAAYKKALDALLKLNIPFEINTGIVFRGLKSLPYPSPNILDYIIKNGGKTVLSSDAHSKDALMFYFSKYESGYTK